MYQQIRLKTRAETSAELEALLFEHGALSVTYLDAQDQPIYQLEPGGTPLWDDITLLALFAAELQLQNLLALLRFQPAVQNREDLAIESVADQAWERSWMENFQAMQFGEQLWICPSWTPPPDPDAINILLDPGLAFGTGTHPTTAMCLRALDADLPPGKRVVDYGCGSGILGIAAARLGATAVLGVDNDPQAITASRDNARRNEVPDAVLPVVLPQDDLVASWQASADWVVANILAGPLVALAPVLTSLMVPGGRLLLAGLLVDQAEAVIDAYAPDVALSIANQQEDWVLLAGEKR